MDIKLRELSDEELILEFQKNNTEDAFNILVQRYKNPLTNFVFRFLGDYEVVCRCCPGNDDKSLQV